MKNIKNILSLLVIFSLWSCEPVVDESDTQLGELPNPSFDIIPGTSANDFTLLNTTTDAFLTNWVVDGLGEFTGETVDLTIDFKGDYPVLMTTFNQGGSASITGVITVTEDNIVACFGNLEILTGCGTKTWKLAQEAGALNVGMSFTETWWGNSLDDLTDRECHFNDTYTFTEDLSYTYDNMGDFWADDDGNGNVWPADLGLNVGCNTSDSWPSQYSDWDSNSHQFSIDANNLTVIGNGAWIGLYKVGSSAEVSEPQSSVKYQILEISTNRLVIGADVGSGFWRFTLTSE